MMDKTGGPLLDLLNRRAADERPGNPLRRRPSIWTWQNQRRSFVAPWSRRSQWANQANSPAVSRLGSSLYSTQKE